MRLTAIAGLAFGVVATGVGLIVGSSVVLAWAATGAVAGIAGLSMLALGREHPSWIVLGAALALTLLAGISPPEILPGTVAGLVTMGVAVLVVLERDEARFALVGLLGLLAVAIWLDNGGWLGAVGLVGYVVGTVATIVLLEAMARTARTAEERYRMLVETASDAIVAIDEESRIVLFNDEATQMFGYRPDEILGQRVELLMPEQVRSDHAERLRVFGAGSDERRQMADDWPSLRGVRSDGTSFPIEVAISKARIGDEIMYTAFVRDVTERRRQQEELADQEHRYRELFDRVPAGLYRTTPDGEILDANPAFVELLGYPSKDAVLQTSVHDIYVDPGDRVVLTEEAEREGVVDTEIQLRRADGELIWVRDRMVAVYDDSGNVTSYDGQLFDVTEQRAVEAELRTLVESKTALIAAVSHELRTPLTAIVGYLELDDGTEAAAGYVAAAHGQALEMSALIEDLLTAARIDNDDLVVTTRSVDVAEVVGGAAAAFVAQAEIEVAVPVGLEALGDPLRLRQILRNLISNAVRHGAPPVRVVCDLAARGDIAIRVIDCGPGVPEDSVEAIFEPFTRAYERGTLAGSIGIGLNVSRHLARLMGGELRYRRHDGHTEFVLELRSPIGARQVA